ncbi:RagB/SusD family nutrient uptake outer membrane protein [Chitinophaga sp. G-6-1-13]|uniref:RagB/SusD family nutrient uptake outer membrane protein n=1 Tax=Chitinophaga fulva TaxID=2728842 RepID=A0A848GLP6_9BACT|nr:RagB/SusD family nutrient uptake outer membrane protein [Chitinophaga fulva]NML38857.1 RagB/SusD family nutrient uptake outer membrane protein [Chitinophaga fulva]
MQKSIHYRNKRKGTFCLRFKSHRLNKSASGVILLMLLPIVACNKFVDVPSPVNKIAAQELFKDDANATSAVTGIYGQMANLVQNIANGSITSLTGITSDELNYINNAAAIKEFQTNSISTNNSTNVGDFWAPAYKYIYQANASLEGIAASTGISLKTKNQLEGECRVVRSLIYFYLIQLYGDVPLITTTNFNTNTVQRRNSTPEIYDFIINDLIEAKQDLAETYPTTGRLRPNLYTAEALLSRVYLYTGQWGKAETEANNVIKSAQYSLQTDLTKIFLSGSNEAIWQIAASIDGLNTREGVLFVNSNANAIPNYLISDALMNGFEANDPRKTAWIGTKTISNKIYYFPYKYKLPMSSTSTAKENYVMFRLAEQYLIRSEAKIRQGKTDEGVKDLNIIRGRARGNNSTILPDQPMGATQQQALSYVIKERRIELMTEWGNRWLDLKRFHLCTATLQPIKPGWQDTDTLFPIPLQQILINKNLTQNSGYN